MFAFIPVQTYLFKRDRLKRGGVGRPEARFLTSLVTVWGFPISLFWLAFTSNGKTNYWSPIIAGTLLGFSDPVLWLAMLTYITGKVYWLLAFLSMPSFLFSLCNPSSLQPDLQLAPKEPTKLTIHHPPDSYPNVAASAIAAFVIPSFSIAAAFAHIGIILFDNLGTTWGFACLAFISLGVVALVYVLFFFGEGLRRRSKLARTF